MFTAFITYNCSLITLPELVVHYNKSNCSKLEPVSGTDNKTINVTCDSIKDLAGRNFEFSLVGNDNTQFISNETFKVTLHPLFLNTTNISVTLTEDSAICHVPNCLAIVDPQYLKFRCNTSDTNRTLPSNCTIKCDNLEPGSMYYASLILLAVPMHDRNGSNNSNFSEDILNKAYKTG